jgi:hypothetical protein
VKVTHVTCHEGTEKLEVWLHPFTTSALESFECSVPRHPLYTLEKGTWSLEQKAGWALVAGLDGYRKFCLHRGSTQPGASFYIAYSTFPFTSSSYVWFGFLFRLWSGRETEGGFIVWRFCASSTSRLMTHCCWPTLPPTVPVEQCYITYWHYKNRILNLTFAWMRLNLEQSDSTASVLLSEILWTCSIEWI